VTTTGDELREQRKALDWSQAELGRRAGLSEETVRKAEAGVTVRPRTIAALTAVLVAALDGRDVAPADNDADGVMLDLPDDALSGLSDVEREEVRAAARLAALSKAREIRGG